jgi:SAM-dependent methyltransferase
MDSLSFDSMAELYGETRVFDDRCFDSALNFLANRFPPDEVGNMFYPGIGTGRIAIPLAEKGYKITGIDISEKMLLLLKERLEQAGRPLPVSFQKADALGLPFSDSAFDIAIAVHLFYFIPQWEKAVDEILRVVKDDGALILMHTGAGTEVPFINERYKAICAAQGCLIPSIGVESNREVVDYCESLGYHTDWIRDRWQWTYNIQLDKALNYLKSRAYSFTAFAPDKIHTRAIQSLAFELQRRFGSLAAEVQVPNQIYFAIISRSD